MDIKSIVRNIIPLPIREPASAKKPPSATETDNERDANGQQSGDEKPPRRKLTQKEIEAAVVHLKNLEGVVQNNLTIRLVQDEDITTVYVEDSTGAVVRRIPEAELAELSQEKDKQSGHLLNKAI